jgi:hypothetical protein
MSKAPYSDRRVKRALEKYWPEISEAASKFYGEAGWGAVQVEALELLAAAQGTRSGFPLGYFAEGSDELRGAGGWPDPGTANAVLRYDPDAMMVVMVMWPDAATSSYLMRLAPRSPGPLRPKAGVKPWLD